jgi:hypothetical protein
MKTEFYFVFGVFTIVIILAIFFIIKYIKHKKEDKINKYTNDHIFESIPSIFPTVGILLTSIGIIIGLWHFNEDEIKTSIKDLLGGIKFSFLATAIGLVLLLIFQKVIEYWKNKIELHITQNNLKPSDNPIELIKNVYSTLEKLDKDKSNSDEQYRMLQDQNERLLEVMTGLQINQKDLTENIQNGFSVIQSVQKEFNDIFLENTQAIVAQLNQGFENVQSVQSETNILVSEKSQAIVSQINDGLTDLQKAQTETNTVFTETGNAIVSKLSEGFANVQSVQSETNILVAEKSQVIVNHINEGLADLQNAQSKTNAVFTESSQAIVSQINEGLTDLHKAQTETNTVFKETGQAIAAKLNDGFENVQTLQSETNAVFTENSQAIVSQINEGLTELQKAQLETNTVFTETGNAIVTKLNDGFENVRKVQSETNSIFVKSSESIVSKMNYGFETIQEEVKTSNAKLIEVSENILIANNANNQLFETKFNEFIILLQENNTKGLVEMMDKATRQFNEQMSGLINKLVQENFAQLNQSVESLNNWQQENKESITSLTTHFKETTELFSHSSAVLKEVAINTKQLVSDDSKLKEIVEQLNKIIIDDDKFISITTKLSNTVELVEKSTVLYEDTASKLNQWVVNEYEFKQGVEILINKLEEFKDFNSGVWESYRKEMQTAVNIIKDTTSTLSDNVENLDAEFYERLSNTLENLDSYIVTLIEREKDE